MSAAKEMRILFFYRSNDLFAPSFLVEAYIPLLSILIAPKHILIQQWVWVLSCQYQFPSAQFPVVDES